MPTQPLPRYDRPFEATATADISPQIRISDLDGALADSSFSPGTIDVIRAITRLTSPAVFPGGGVGLEYGALLKTVTRPDILSRHVQETADHLRAREVDLLVVPGMSGYPIGAMYSMASGIPALLLKKQTWDPDASEEVPPGSFIIPSYTGNADTVISADMGGARDILTDLVRSQLAAQSGQDNPTIRVRIAGADEIIDKATMATAITENAPLFVRAAIEHLLEQGSALVGNRTVEIACDVVAWVTPLMKGYGNSDSTLARRFGIRPFAGAIVSAVQVDPPAIGFAGLGLVLLGANQ